MKKIMIVLLLIVIVVIGAVVYINLTNKITGLENRLDAAYAARKEVQSKLDKAEKKIKELEELMPENADPSNANEKGTTEKTSEKAASPSTSTTTFTNNYGTPTTKCAHPGCSNYIASSGDTNCCTTHSKRCAECGKYIDEDATYCMDCIKKAAEKTAVKNSRKCDKTGCSNDATKTLTVTQPSGESATFYLCSSHYSEYKSTFNSKEGWTAR